MAHIAALFLFWLALNNRLADYANLIKAGGANAA
jgi:hypothetical protein